MLSFYFLPSAVAQDHHSDIGRLSALVDEATPIDTIAGDQGLPLLDHLTDTPFARLVPIKIDGRRRVAIVPSDALIEMVCELDAGPWRLAMPDGFETIEQCIRAAVAEEASLLVSATVDDRA